MPRPYSLDLRERVIARIEAGETRTAAAAHFAVSAPSAIRWAQLKRDTGGVAPKPAGGTRPYLWRLSENGFWRGSRRSLT
jgi:putative transposase